MHAGVAETIYLENIPFPGWLFSIRIFEATLPSGFSLAKSLKLCSRIIPEFLSFNLGSGNIHYTLSNTPVVTAVTFLNLKFLRSQPKTITGAMRTYGMIQKSAIAPGIFSWCPF
jgi:hypothetical protein